MRFFALHQFSPRDFARFLVVIAILIFECTVNKFRNKYEEPLNRLLEVLISVVVIGIGAILFLKIMTPNDGSILYQSNGFFRFGLFTVSLFLVMNFIFKPLLNCLKTKK